MVRFSPLFLILFGASPALAADHVASAEPGDFGLFALGLLGLVVGRHLAKPKPSKDD